MRAWRSPALGLIAAGGSAVLLSFAARLPFWDAPLTTDEGGYGQVARLWARSEALYGGAWADRPQGLLLVFRALLHLDGGSPEAMRALAAVVGALAVLATMVVALRLAGRIAACFAGLAMATAGASPFVEGFTLSGELLASLPAILSLLAFVGYLERGGVRWLALAGLLTGCAVMVKQSAFDAGLAAAAFLVLTEGWRGLRRSAVLAGFAAIPVAIGAAAAASFADWWYAVVAYRGEGDSLFTEGLGHRLDLLVSSLPAAAKGLGLLALLAALGWRGAPLLARLWLAAALLGVLGGGNFHAHYYLQLVPPLSLLAGIGAARLVRSPRRLAAITCAAAAVATLAVTAPLWFASAEAQARAVWPRDPHLVSDADVASFVRAHTRPEDEVLALWAAANQYYLADRKPAVRYLWRRNVETIPGALDAVRAVLQERRAALVVQAQPSSTVDPSGTTARLLRRNYRLAAVVRGVPIYAPRRTPSRRP